MLLIDLYVFLIVFTTSNLYQTNENVTISLQMQKIVSLSQSDSFPIITCSKRLLMSFSLLYIPLKWLP